LNSGSYGSFNYEDLTIAFFAFVVCDVNGNLLTGGTSKENKMTSMIAAAHAAGTKAYLSFGGGSYYGSPTFYNMARTESSRKEFAHQVKEFCLTKGFDGFDVDWEGLNNSAEGAAHEALMSTLKDTLHSAGLGLIVTVQQGGNATNFTYAAMNHADLVQIMSYDATGTWAASPAGQHSSYAFAEDGISYWGNTRGISKSKLVSGVPFYGWRFENMPCPCAGVSYGAIASAYPSLTDSEDYVATGPFSKTYFNGFETIMSKVGLAYDNNLPGIMIWEISQDATGNKSLLRRMASELQANGLTVKKLETSIP
jgi:chitinase